MNLFGLESISIEDREAVARRNLNNLLTSYADEADIFTEVIQNAYDSILSAVQLGLYENNEPELTIVIGRRYSGHHYLYVADNGLGMDKEVAHNLTVPGFSHGKQKGRTVGYKGVGASYFFAASQKAALKTVNSVGEATEYTIRGSYEWVKSEEEPSPTIDGFCDVPEYLKNLLPKNRGTGVFFQFHEGMKPKNLNGIVLIGDSIKSEIRNWLSFFSTKTALGSVEDHSDLNIKITVHLDYGSSQDKQVWHLGEYDRDAHKIGYAFPYRVFKVSKSVDEIDSTPRHQMAKHTRKYQAVHKKWSADEIIDATQTLESDELDKLRQHLKWVDAYFCYSTDVMKEVNSRLGGRSNFVRHGIKISCDGIPQGRNIDLSLTSSQGLDRQCHIVMSFEGLELDTGRKISADEVVSSAIAKMGRKIVDVLKDYRWAMKKKDRPDVQSDISEWSNAIDSRSQTSLVRELYKSHGKAPVINVDPDNESEVIALFSSLLSLEVLKGITVKAISGYARYDALVDIDCTNSDLCNIDDVLSIRDKDSSLEGKYKVLEFKYNFEDLLSDFEEKKKNPAEIDILVCWSVPSLNIDRGQFSPSYGKWNDHRKLYGSSYIWSDENESNEIIVIALKNLISELLAKHELEKAKPSIGQGTLSTIETRDQEAMV